MLKVTVRNLVAHKIRLALTAFAVVLGVAFVAGTLVFTDTMGRQFDRLFSRTGKGVAVQVRPKKVVESEEGAAAPTLPASLVPVVARVPGVARARGGVSGFAAVVGRNGKVVGGSGPPQLGVDWDPADRNFPVRAGRGPSGPGEVAVDRRTAGKAGLKVGDRARVVIQGPTQSVTVVGIVDSGSLMGATLTAFDQGTAQRLLLRPGRFSDITVAARSGVSETVLRDRIQRVLPPPDYEAITGTKLREENKSQVATIMSFIRTALLIFAVISIFVGAFIIFNTFSMLVAQRSRELALLRAVGASRRQVTRAVLGEATGVGLVGSTVGLGAGVGLAVLLQALFNALGADLGGGLAFTYKPVLWSYAVGMVVTMAAAYFPARRAAGIPPVAAMHDDVAMPQRSLRIRVVLGSPVIAAGVVLGGFGLGGSGAALLGVGLALVFLGVAMLAPVLARPVVTALGAAYPRVFRTPGRLATQNALRNPRRTAATASALMIGLALVSGITVMSASAKASITRQVDASFAADYMVTAAGRVFGPAEPGRAVRAAAGVEQVTALYAGRFVAGGKARSFVATERPGDLRRAARLSLVSGSTEVGGDGLLVDRPTATSERLQVGSAVGVRFADGRTASLRVAGIYAENPLIGSRVLALPAYLAHTDHPTGVALMVNVAKADTATRQGVERALGPYPGLKVQDRSDVKRSVQQGVDQFVLLLTALLALSILIAALGIINTLALSVIERTREIGLLRAIGTSRRQTRRMIRLESVLIAVFGAVLGLAIGVVAGIGFQRALRGQGLNVLSVPVTTLAGYLVLSAVIGVLAAPWPAWRASRMDVLTAIAVE
ncbi:ABC transporter permease [Actinoallomurus rhizosphaericola]|uniref:ABC transporter permease n=1 Tax=Actinoallomurus rhizosphaericola TaxID=2952536 RepID=UPI002092AC05|nr:ABC transporter permease [Actinoallomurus rhizosphaericola]MCO5997120.1 ABC transporter permease [Actinoallomurus rhizosphaericola]